MEATLKAKHNQRKLKSLFLMQRALTTEKKRKSSLIEKGLTLLEAKINTKLRESLRILQVVQLAPSKTLQ